VRDRVTGSNILCSAKMAGTDGGSGDSFDPLISADGRYVVFESTATNLVAGDTNNTTDIFAFDVLTRTIQLVSANTNGVPGNSFSFLSTITPDGHYAAFESQASDLVTNDSNGNWRDVFVRDLVAGTTTLVSANCNGTGSGNDYSYLPAISADGRYVAFESYAWDLAPGDFSAYVENVFRRDLLTGTTVLLSQNRVLTGGGNDYSYYTHISTNGSVVSFESDATDLIAEDANHNTDIFAWTATAVAPAVNLVAAKSASTNQTVEGNDLTYTITVTNHGSLNASGVLVADALPASLAFVSASSSQGAVTNSGGNVTAVIGGLNAGAGASISITANTLLAGNVTNSATASSNEPDSIPANNSSSVVVLVTPVTPPPLSVTISNSQLVITWPSSTPSAFNLETTTNLLPVLVWTPVTNSVSTNGLFKFVTLGINVNEPERFYRLKK
jgi:uncharacterized repeat protein (TIGR01451 family)